MFRKRNRGRKPASLRLSVENLECRQMMAADVATLAFDSPLTIDAGFQSSSAPLVAQAPAVFESGATAAHAPELPNPTVGSQQPTSRLVDFEPLPCGVTENGPRGNIGETVRLVADGG